MSIRKNGSVAATLDSFENEDAAELAGEIAEPDEIEKAGKGDFHTDGKRRDDADQERGDHGAAERTKAADNHHHEDHDPEFERHVGVGRVEGTRHRAGETGQKGADAEDAHEHHRHVMTKCLDHTGTIDRGAHDDADPGAGEHQIKQGEHHQRDTAHEQAIERIAAAANLEGRELKRRRHAVFDREIAVENLDDLGDDHRKTERDQKLVGMAIGMHAPQDDPLNQNAQARDDERGEDDGQPEAGERLQRVGEIGPEHVERSVGRSSAPPSCRK